jgi:hypothetical protein
MQLADCGFCSSLLKADIENSRHDIAAPEAA